ncbi:LA2681 family HEPN domain-containing protein [Rahnella sp. PD12R]|uniref:LA2681 family HEPN domain-containing protein n=1 Tax=Rahnella sp. PD12R TaxID=2855688 RepID=UPI00210726C2|nr:LA2681 family HEPN domain-containing protein [Rahnella sp. PD12R]
MMNTDKNLLEEMSKKADALIMADNRHALKFYVETLLEKHIDFEERIDEANFLYIIGNCYQVLYKKREMNWYSDDLSKAVIFFRKALNAANDLRFPSKEDLYLKSCIQTNLANSLSAQGRAFCSIPFWDSAISQKNPVAMICKAQNELYLAATLYDSRHQPYHLFVAYKLILQGIQHKEYLFEDQLVAFDEDGEFMKFKSWFEENFNESFFEINDDENYEFTTRKEKSYLTWCGENKLFINDLNDVFNSTITYQDIITLPSFRYQLNKSLSMHETLMYHGNFDELKNEYCYARYLFFTALNIPLDAKHMFNDTYPHVEDMSHSITNLKSSHYKSAFRILYSLFDKISYFLHRFLQLNDIKDDSKITFDAIFRDISKDKSWVPNPKLKTSDNYFIHALFYILKDIRDVKDAAPIARWLDPDAKSFSDIRNALEHRSLKIVDDFGYTLTQSDKDYTSAQLEIYKAEKVQCEIDLKNVYHDIKNIKNGVSQKNIQEALSRQEKLIRSNQDLISLIDEQRRLSTHSLLVTVSEFESRTLTLMKLARNSIMYLSLALHVEEKSNPEGDELFIVTEVPLR